MEENNMCYVWICYYEKRSLIDTTASYVSLHEAKIFSIIYLWFTKQYLLSMGSSFLSVYHGCPLVVVEISTENYADWISAR